MLSSRDPFFALPRTETDTKDSVPKTHQNLSKNCHECGSATLRYAHSCLRLLKNLEKQFRENLRVPRALLLPAGFSTANVISDNWSMVTA